MPFTLMAFVNLLMFQIFADVFLRDSAPRATLVRRTRSKQATAKSKEGRERNSKENEMIEAEKTEQR